MSAFERSSAYESCTFKLVFCQASLWTLVYLHVSGDCPDFSLACCFTDLGRTTTTMC